MSERHYRDENHYDMDFSYNEDSETIRLRKNIKRKIYDRQEKQWLKKEIEDYDGEMDDFDWSYLNKHDQKKS